MIIGKIDSSIPASVVLYNRVVNIDAQNKNKKRRA
jgi:hypothetical protein